MIKLFSFIALFVALSPSIAFEHPAFPLKLSENRRYLVDQAGVPFLYQADTAWMLFLNLTTAEADEYLAVRKAQGFNAVQVMLTGFLVMPNRAGELPFFGAPPQQDFARPNPAFFDPVDSVMAAAERQGLLLAVAPAWLGCCGEGWAGVEKDGALKPLNANGVEKCLQLGRWLGTRFGKYANIMWILGGDNDPHESREEIRALGLGLKQTAPHQLITYHPASSRSSTDVWPADEPWLDVSMVYTYFRGFDKAWNKNQPDVYEISHAEYVRMPVRPFFLGESTYEGEHGDWGSALQVRKQAYWCLLGGGFGHAYGSPNWRLPQDWRSLLYLPGAESLRHLRTLFESLPWHRLEPDIQDGIVVQGRGVFAANDYVTAAVADDGSFAVVYVPGRRSVTLDLGRITGDAVEIRRFDPRTGADTVIGTYAGKQHLAVDMPDDGDWVLVLRAVRSHDN